MNNNLLEGVRILDLSRLLPGPYCTWLLRAMGAQVDRVEPHRGDMARHIPPLIDGVGVYFASFAKGMRSFQLNFRHPDSMGLLLQMLANYDVLVEGFRPGTLEKMGLDPQELQERYPKLIIARLSGYGQDGPMAEASGHDNNYIGYAGILAGMGLSEKGIALPTVQIADTSGAMIAAMSICAALHSCQRTGKGTILDISLTESAIAMNAPLINLLTKEDRKILREGEMLNGGASFYRCYQCADQKWITVGAIEAKFQQRLYAVFGGLGAQTLQAGFLTKKSEHWLREFPDACVAPVLDPSEVFREPHFQERGVFREQMVQPPIGECLGKTPQLGEHNTEILRELGVSEQRILELQQNGTFR